MRLALVTQTVTRGDGQGRVNLEIALQAARSGWQVTLVTSGVEQELREFPNVSWVSIPWYRRATSICAELLFARLSGNWLRANRANLDIVHANGFNTLAGSDVNTAHFVHGAWIKSPAHTARSRRDHYGAYQWVYSALNARLERAAFRHARTVVAVSHRVREELIGIGVPLQRLEVILNGVDLAEFCPGTEMEGREALGLPCGVPLGLFVGDIRTPRKNLDTVLHALTRVPSAHLAVVGSVAGSPFPALSMRLGLADRVQFLGYRRDVSRLMRASDYFVFPSRYEACSLVILEALASGLPVVTSQTAGGAEIITSDCGVVLTDPDDVDALADALKELSADPRRRARMGAASRRIAESYSWQRMADEYLRLYQN